MSKESGNVTPPEKGDNVVDYQTSTTAIPHEGGPERDANWFTRNGLNLDSFKKKHYGPGLVELERPMKGRHLHMIAIGGSIGAGFFVGSGGALSNGVSFHPQNSILSSHLSLSVLGARMDVKDNLLIRCFENVGPRFSLCRFPHYRYHDVQRR
jgi:hypothetical protein